MTHRGRSGKGGQVANVQACRHHDAVSRPSTAHARPVPSTAELVQIGRDAGLDAVGVAPAGPFTTTRRHLERRKAAGFHGGMAFTYRRPERSTDRKSVV